MYVVHWKFFVIFNSMKVLIFRHENSLAKYLVSAETRIGEEMTLVHVVIKVAILHFMRMLISGLPELNVS